MFEIFVDKMTLLLGLRIPFKIGLEKMFLSNYAESNSNELAINICDFILFNLFS